ncbi:MAG TPA: VWA domain-containing protein [bacterium]|nr:VWA domain-containing protein [bacterium]
MNPKFNLHPRRIGQALVAVLLAGLIVYGAVGRASSHRAAPAGPADTGWKTQGAAGGHVKVRSNLSQTKVVQGSDGLVYLEVDLEAPEASDLSRARRPTDFVIVLDRSGSMADYRKMEFAQKAIGSLINQLKTGDRFALVDFDSVVETPIPLTEVSESAKDRFRGEVLRITPRDGTNLGGGLIAGIDAIQSAGRRTGHPEGTASRAQRMILLSDGLANEGITDTAELGRIAARAVSGEFALSTIGVGLDFNEDLMASIADHGTGNYTFLEDLSSLDKVLAQEFYGASRIYASQIKVKLDLSSGIEAVEASGYPIEKEAGVAVIRPGHLYAGQKKTLFVTLKLPTDALYTKPLGSATVSYAVKEQGYTVPLFGSDLKVACLPQEKREEATASIVPGVYKEAWTKNNYGRLLKDNADKVRSGDREGALGTISAHRAKLEEAYAAAPVPEMKAQLDDLKKMEDEVRDAFNGPDASVKSKRLSKGYQYQGIQQQRQSN